MEWKRPGLASLRKAQETSLREENETFLGAVTKRLKTIPHFGHITPLLGHITR